jgi:hypothetical protein
MEAKDQCAGTGSRAAGRYHRPVRVDARIAHPLAEEVKRQNGPIGAHKLGKRKIDASGYVTAAEPGPRLRLDAGEPPRRPGIDHLLHS